MCHSHFTGTGELVHYNANFLRMRVFEYSTKALDNQVIDRILAYSKNLIDNVLGKTNIILMTTILRLIAKRMVYFLLFCIIIDFRLLCRSMVCPSDMTTMEHRFNGSHRYKQILLMFRK